MLKVWGRVNSSNVMKVLWCLNELGIEFERIDAGMTFGVVNEPFYRALNPNGRVPTLEDGNLVLWESNVIVRYLSAKYGLGRLCPADPAARAVADQWMDWEQTTASADVTYVFWGQVRGREENRDPETVAACADRLGTKFAILDGRLAGRDFILGDHLTMADIPVGCVVWRWANLDLDRPSLPNLEAWHRRLQERPGFRKWVAQPLS